MAEIVNMPKLGFDMAEGTLVRWVILEGEPITKGAILAEIETDKATVEVEAQHEGILLQHLVTTGNIVPINTPIAVVGAAGEEVDIDKLLAEIAPVEEKVDVSDEIIPEVQTVSPETTVPEELTLTDTHLPGGVKASPLARRIAQKMGIDLRAVTGSGSGGRITKKDVETYLTLPAVQTPSPAATAGALPTTTSIPALPLPSTSAPPSVSLPIKRLRAAIGKRMTEAKQHVPHFYVTHEYDMEPIISLRKQVNGMLPEEEKISINDFIVKAVALSLRQFPNLNASLDNDQVIHHGPVNVGIAVGVDGGLLTVVCHDADLKPLRQIAQEIRAMVSRARDGKVRMGDIEGSTFTVSNMGMFDVENFAAIINPPETAILAVGSAAEVPVVNNGEIKPGLRMKATISVDHRVSDGVEAARYLQTLAQQIENPIRLLI